MGSSESKEEDSVAQGSEEFADLQCDICNEDGKTEKPAGFCVDCSDFLCEECFKAHTRTRASRYHVLQDKDCMPQQRPRATVTCPDKCTVHSNETIKFYCKSHKALGCGGCMITNHRNCDGVEEIENVSRALAERKDFKQFNKSLNILQERSKTIITDSSVNMKSAETYCTDAINSVKQLRKDFDNLFDKLETNITAESETLKSEDTAKLTGVCDKAIRVLQEVEGVMSRLDTMQRNNQSSQAFIEMIRTKEKIKDWTETLDAEVKRNEAQRYEFETTAEMRRVVEEQEFPGKLVIQK